MGLETGAAIALIGTAISAVGTGSAIYHADKQADQAKENADEQRRLGQQQRDALALREKQEAETSAVRLARERQRRASAGTGGRRGTILSGPMGLPDDTLYQGRTVAGSGEALP